MKESSRKLLIIDDDAPVRQSMAAYLKDSGLEVFESAESTAGLAIFASESIDLVLVDLRMPGMDGLSVLKRLKEIASEVPVIVISGAGVMSDVVSALRLGASDYFIKPIIDMEMLVHSVRKVLMNCDLLHQNRLYSEKLEQTNKELQESLRVLERDQLAGKQVQLGLLPKPFVTPEGYAIAHHITPSLYLSGDFIDYTHVKKRYLAFYLTDVSGHGASSAFVTVWLKHIVSRMVREEGLFGDEGSFETGTNAMLKSINDEINKTHLNHHLTFFVGVIDTSTHEMRYVVAGHLPMPALITPYKKEFLAGAGKPVGIFNDVEWNMYSCILPEKFSLVCFSDGVLEILPPENLLEKESYLLAILEDNAKSIESICDTLGIESVKDAPDDIAVLTITRGY